MPTYEAMIHIASVVNETDYYACGRTLENLGLADLHIEELKEFVLTGFYPRKARFSQSNMA